MERYYQCTTAFWIFDVPDCASPSCSIVLVILVLVLSYLRIGRNMQDILLGIALSTWTILLWPPARNIFQCLPIFLNNFLWRGTFYAFKAQYIVDAVRSSRILIGKQKLGRTFNSDKLGGIDFTKFSKLTMCSAGASRCWLYNGLGFLLGTAHGQFWKFCKIIAT